MESRRMYNISNSMGDNHPVCTSPFSFIAYVTSVMSTCYNTLLSTLSQSDTYQKSNTTEQSSQALCPIFKIFLFSHQRCLEFLKKGTAHTLLFFMFFRSFLPSYELLQHMKSGTLLFSQTSFGSRQASPWSSPLHRPSRSLQRLRKEGES